MTNNNVIVLEDWKREKAKAERAEGLEIAYEFWGAAEWENLTHSEHLYVVGTTIPSNPWK